MALAIFDRERAAYFPCFAVIDRPNILRKRLREMIGEHGSIIGGTKSPRSEEHTSELQSLMRTSYAVFCLKKKNTSKPAPHLSYNNLSHSHIKYITLNRQPPTIIL